MKKEANTKRRNFLLAASLGTAGVAVATITGQKAAAPAPQKQAAPENGSGYQVTEHVLNYYRTTRV